MPENPLISIVIASYAFDRLKDITELLDSINAQTYKNVETILIVERSKDLYNGIISYIQQKKILNVKPLFNEKEPGLSSSRNLGIRQSTGEIVAFIDDDALLFSDWAEELIKTFGDKRAVGVTGPAILKWEDSPAPVWFPEEFDWITGGTGWFAGDKKREVRNVWGMNMSFLKEALNKYQFLLGHDASADGAKVGLEGDDTELSLRIHKGTGRPIIYNPSVKVYHKVYAKRLTKKFVRQKSYWQGYTKAVLRKNFKREKQEENVLTTEYTLLRRILFKLLPSIAGRFFVHPVVACKKLSFTCRVMYHIGLGYFSGRITFLGNITRKSYGASH